MEKIREEKGESEEVGEEEGESGVKTLVTNLRM